MKGVIVRAKIDHMAGIGRFLYAVPMAFFALTIMCSISWALVPTLELVNPSSVVKDSVGVSIAAQGTGFDSSTVVRWGGFDLATTIYGTSAAVAVVPDSLLASVGVGVVTMSNLDGASNAVTVAVVDSIAVQLEPILFILAGLLGAMAFIFGFGSRL